MSKTNLKKIIESDEVLQRILSRKENKEGQPIVRELAGKTYFDLFFWHCGRPSIKIREVLVRGKERTKVEGFIYYCKTCKDITNYIDYEVADSFGDPRNYYRNEV